MPGKKYLQRGVCICSKKHLRRGYILMWVLLSSAITFTLLSAKIGRSVGLLRRTAFSINQEQQLLAAHSANNYARNLMYDGFIIPAEGLLFATNKLQVQITKQDQQILCRVSPLNEQRNKPENKPEQNQKQGKVEPTLFRFPL